MKAVVCAEPSQLEIVERVAPTPGPNEALVRIRRVGLCGTDYHIFAGRHPFLSYPRVMGHELAGDVEQAPANSGFHVGQLVAINPYLNCGTCIACRRGKPNACVNISVLGVHADGGMCERLVVPQTALIDATGLTPDHAAMLEFLAIGAHAVARGRLQAGDRVLIVGAGPIGIASGLFARRAGAIVTLADTRATRLAYARTRLGFDTIVEAGPDLSTALDDLTDGEMFDAVFDATGNLTAMAQSLNYVAHGGTLVLVGVAPGELVFADPEFHKRETTLVASRNALAEDFRRVIDAIRGGDIPIDALHTHSLDADEVPTRLPELITEADHVLKAVVRF
ncbi:zinc-binding alcohol dehydrogenase family protein [Sphingomonas sp.]|uniref:zinc-binding alcohol dehydrogenase family protein n=1 Tax=Sphingomonas sp. TaxID=28214 RepID=UPI003B3B4C0A